MVLKEKTVDFSGLFLFIFLFSDKMDELCLYFFDHSFRLTTMFEKKKKQENLISFIARLFAFREKITVDNNFFYCQHV